MINSEHIKQVIAMINSSPYFKLLSIVMTDIGEGYSRLEVSMDNKHLNPFGSIHGGVYSSLIDTAAYWALYCDIGDGEGMVSLDLSVNNIAGTDNGKLFVEAKRIKKGRSICISEGSISDENGKLLALGTSKMMITPGKQTIDQAFLWMKTENLEPKYFKP